MPNTLASSQLLAYGSIVMHRRFISGYRHTLWPAHDPLYRPALVTDLSYKNRSQGTVRWAPPFGARAALGSGIYMSYNPSAAGL